MGCTNCTDATPALGVPAQVAGCADIVLATPPCPDSRILPKVMYVMHLVGTSAVLKAGGMHLILYY